MRSCEHCDGAKCAAVGRTEHSGIYPYHTFTQDNFFNARTEAVLPSDVLRKQGMTLDQIGGLIALHPVNVAVRHAADSGLDGFRAEARDYLSKPDHYVIVNYLRKAIGQERGGHISPLAAYDAETDRFLILDVARYKYPPVWVMATDLFNAMNTTDSSTRIRREASCSCPKRQSNKLRAAPNRQGDAGFTTSPVLVRHLSASRQTTRRIFSKSRCE